MNRRLFVASGLASVGALAPYLGAKADDDYATPVATPLARIYSIDEVYRSFHLASGGLDTMLKGQPYWLIFDVLRFSKPADAKEAIPTLRDNIRQSWRNGSSAAYQFGSPEPVSVRRMGDEAYAWSVTMDDTSEDDDDVILAIVLARKEAILYVAEATAASGNPYPLLADQVAAMLKRKPSDRTRHTDDNGMHTGGLWDVLPTLHDLPDGYQFDSDIG